MPHYFDPAPDAVHKKAEVTARVHGQDFVFQTDSAVFSRLRLDHGTELLIETVIKDMGKPRGRMLDLGCGYGPVGIVFKRLFPALEVVLSDINQRALDLAKANAAGNHVQYVDIVASDGFKNIRGDFDLILANPPIRAGKAVVCRLFSEASARLRPGGRLYVVIRKQQGAPSAQKFLRELTGQAETVGRSAGFWVIRSGRFMIE